jgi:hypothetical protein
MKSKEAPRKYDKETPWTTIEQPTAVTPDGDLVWIMELYPEPGEKQIKVTRVEMHPTQNVLRWNFPTQKTK